MEDNLGKRIRQMAEYLEEEAIAAALKIPAETVRDLLAGRASMSKTETERQTELHVHSTPVYRQRIVSVWRGRGGAGCTSVAVCLAYVLEQANLTVLVVDLNLVTAGSDLGYYLRTSEYPNMETLSKGGPLSSAVIQVENGLWVLLPPYSGIIEKGLVEQSTIEARMKFDAVIFDLPNIDANHVMEAVSCSNTLVMVTNGLQPELNRVLARKSHFSQTDVIFVANGYSFDGRMKKEFANVVEIPEDRDLPSRMERGIFYKKGSPLTTGAEKIRDLLFGAPSQGDGGFRKAIRMIIGNAS